MTSESAVSRWHRILDDPSPLVKQAPTLLAVVFAAIVVAAAPGLGFSDVFSAALGGALIAIATGYAAVLTRRGHAEGLVVLVIPMVDILGLGLFRAGTGGAQSLFGSLVLIPVIWLAAAAGIRYVFLVAALTSLALLMPYLREPPANAVDWLRGVISPLVFAAVAAVVNELSRQHRLRTQQAERLVRERTAALEENVRAVASLRESEREYRLLLESFQGLWSSITAQAVIATDARGIIVEWNPGAERLFGLPLQEALADVCIDRFFSAEVLDFLAAERGTVPDDTSEVTAGLQALFAGADAEVPVDVDIQVTTEDGTTVPARVTVTRWQGSRGHQGGYIFVVTDETRAVDVARMKDEFVGMISHELRTPLSAIIGFLDLLSEDPAHPLTAAQMDFVRIIERNAQRLLALVGDLLFTAQVESGRFPLKRRDIDVCEAVRVAVASSGPHAQREGIDLTADVPAEAVMLRADAGRIGQALDNLLSNALKFTPRGGEVRATVRASDTGVVIAVRDTGVGIPIAEQRQLFTRFFRASTATRNAIPGIGLGLSITRAIVMAHSGTMDFESDEGRGTEFRITIPRDSAKADAGVPRPTPERVGDVP